MHETIDGPMAPDVLIELHPDGWAIYIHKFDGDDPEKISLPLQGGSRNG